MTLMILLMKYRDLSPCMLCFFFVFFFQWICFCVCVCVYVCNGTDLFWAMCLIATQVQIAFISLTETIVIWSVCILSASHQTNWNYLRRHKGWLTFNFYFILLSFECYSRTHFTQSKRLQITSVWRFYMILDIF